MGTVQTLDKVAGQLCKTLKGYAHGKDTGTDTTVITHLAADDGFGYHIHDKPDNGFYKILK